ncbi:hypothetical protein J6590_027011 [Homalodisca vitripennis]|nr:hypothetical protein J6590_027011 [Homalodisca vitripennis]
MAAGLELKENLAAGAATWPYHVYHPYDTAFAGYAFNGNPIRSGAQRNAARRSAPKPNSVLAYERIQRSVCFKYWITAGSHPGPPLFFARNLLDYHAGSRIKPLWANIRRPMSIDWGGPGDY